MNDRDAVPLHYTNARFVVSSVSTKLITVLLSVLLCAASALAQSAAPATPRKLPSAEKIVDSYLKAVGGKKAAAAQRDVTYEWIVELNNQPIGTARLLRKAPASERLEFTFGNGQIISGKTPSEISLGGIARTFQNVQLFGEMTAIENVMEIGRASCRERV